MKYLKAFMAGVALPVIVCPFIFMWLAYNGNIRVLEHVPMYFVPMIWGLWNVILVGLGNKCIIKDVKTRYVVHGGTLGFLLALVGMFVFYVDLAFFGMPLPFAWGLLIVAPIVYALAWRYVVYPLNKLVKA